MKHLPHVVNIFDASFKSTLSWLQYKQKQTQTPSYFAWLLWFLNPPFFSPGDLGLSVCWCSRCCCRRRCSWFCYRYVCIAACRGVLSDISSWRRQRIHWFYTDRRGERCESISLKFLQLNFSRLFPLTQMCIVFHFFVAWIDHYFFRISLPSIEIGIKYPIARRGSFLSRFFLRRGLIFCGKQGNNAWST